MKPMPPVAGIIMSLLPVKLDINVVPCGCVVVVILRLRLLTMNSLTLMNKVLIVNWG